MLRPYQQEASDAAIDWMMKSIEPALIEAVTAAGKSHIIADIARRIHLKTGKRVLCLAPSAELVTQNFEKYVATGNKASMFSASAGQKSLRHPVIFGSPLTVKNRISRFKDGYALVCLDEAHGITPTIKSIIEEMREGNPNLRIIGLTATPYRLGDGYIFRQWPNEKVNGDDTARSPYFAKCVYRITGPELIEQGFLTPPVISEIGAEGYDTHSLVANAQGKFDAAAVDRAYHGHGRKTAAIVADVVARSRDRKGVMLFAATVQHAHEIMASLPPELSAIVTAETPKGERASLIKRFKRRELKYLVNVSVLTTGFDAPHVDVIAILRKTESVGLLQQIIGRGMRLSDGKRDCLILDYTTNLEDHCPDGDLFAPVVKAKSAKGESNGIKCLCPSCGSENQFTAKPDTLEYEKDDFGYCLDLDGNQVMTEWGPMAGHFGRRCFGFVDAGGGKLDRCNYRWTYKPCPHCDEPNDIAARYCQSCKREIIDPNEKLIMDFRAMKKDPAQLQTDRVLSATFTDNISRSGREQIVATWVTPYRQFTTYIAKKPSWAKQAEDLDRFMKATKNMAEVPETITYRKSGDFYNISRYNAPADEAPLCA